MLARNGLLQMDSVNVLVRAHYMPLFSRLGPYPLDLLDGAAKGRKRLLFEYWAHEASLLPVETWPLMRWRMERAARGDRIYKGVATFGRERADYVARGLRQVDRSRPDCRPRISTASAARAAGGAGATPRRRFEWLFWAGKITSAERRPSFERVYDLPERVLPAAIFNAPDVPEADAHRELLRISARALGVATATDLRDYFRLPPEAVKGARPRAGRKRRAVAGQGRGLVAAGLAAPRRAHAAQRACGRALLSPFDPLVWERSRTERLFDFHYRIEIYTPAHKRVHGYYVLPFLYRRQRSPAASISRPTARRACSRVQSAFAEPGAPQETAEGLARRAAADGRLARVWSASRYRHPATSRRRWRKAGAEANFPQPAIECLQN